MPSRRGRAAWRVSPRPKRRGPVEAYQRRKALLVPARHLRALKGAAPLKLQIARDCPFNTSHLRALKGAAPLKHEHFHGGRGVWVQSPRPKRRGPVEACGATATSPTRPGNLRALKGAAPLKQDAQDAFAHRVLSSPRPKRRGPVEARGLPRVGDKLRRISAP